MKEYQSQLQASDQKRKLNFDDSPFQQLSDLNNHNYQSFECQEASTKQVTPKSNNTRKSQVKLLRKDSTKQSKSKLLMRQESQKRLEKQHSNLNVLVKQKSKREKHNKDEIQDCEQEGSSQKNDKRKRIKDILKSKLGIININELVLGKKKKFAVDGNESHVEDIIYDKQKQQKQGQNEDGQQHRTIFSDIYKFKGILGIGVFGVVILVTNIQDQCQRALKIIYKTRLSEEETNVIKTESEILQKLSNKPNIVKFHQMYEGRSYIFIEMDYIPGGQLKRIYEKRLKEVKSQDWYKQQLSLLKEQDDCQHENDYYEQRIELKQPLFSDEEASTIIKGILQGLVGIHELDVIHRDIKPENILLDKVEYPISNDVKIVDFGLSAKFRGNQKQQIDDKIGTLLFMAPEQISMQNYGKKIDMFACGIVLYYMFCGKHPIYQYGDNQLTYKSRITTIEPEKWLYPAYVSKYDAKRALQHPWITRNSNDKIPLTRTEEIQQYNVHNTLSKLFRAVTFLSIVKAKTDPLIQQKCHSNIDTGKLQIISEIKGYDTHYANITKGLEIQYLNKLKCDGTAAHSEYTDLNSFTMSSFLGNQDNTAITEGSKVHTAAYIDDPQSNNVYFDQSNARERAFLPQISNKLTQRDDQREFSIKKQSAKKELIGAITREREKFISQYHNNSKLVESKIQSKMGSPDATTRYEYTTHQQPHLSKTTQKVQLENLAKSNNLKYQNPKSIDQTPQKLNFNSTTTNNSHTKAQTVKKQSYYSDFNLTSNFQSELNSNFNRGSSSKYEHNMATTNNIKLKETNESPSLRQSIDYQSVIINEDSATKNFDLQLTKCQNLDVTPKKLLGKTLTLNSNATFNNESQNPVTQYRPFPYAGRKQVLMESNCKISNPLDNNLTQNSVAHYSMPPIQKSQIQQQNQQQYHNKSNVNGSKTFPLSVNINHLKQQSTTYNKATKQSRNYVGSMTVESVNDSNKKSDATQQIKKNQNQRYNQQVPLMATDQNKQPVKNYQPYQNIKDQNLTQLTKKNYTTTANTTEQKSGILQKHSLSVCKSNELSQNILHQLASNQKQNQNLQPKKRMTQVDASAHVKLLQQQIMFGNGLETNHNNFIHTQTAVNNSKAYMSNNGGGVGGGSSKTNHNTSINHNSKSNHHNKNNNIQLLAYTDVNTF